MPYNRFTTIALVTDPYSMPNLQNTCNPFYKVPESSSFILIFIFSILFKCHGQVSGHGHLSVAMTNKSANSDSFIFDFDKWSPHLKEILFQNAVRPKK